MNLLLKLNSLGKRLLNIRVIRYGLVGGIGIPVNELALFVFTYLLSSLALTFNLPFVGQTDLHYALDSACAFEVSTTVNFVLNQLFTYHEQKIQGWRHWIQRAAKAQLTSLSALLLSFIVGLVLVYGFRVNQYIANPTGIIVAFGYNFFISKKLVFRPTTSSPEPLAMEIKAQNELEVPSAIQK